MARYNLWTPLLVILTVQLMLLTYLNFKTSTWRDKDLVSVQISSPDPYRERSPGPAGKTRRGQSLLSVHSVLQIGAPASEISRGKRNSDGGPSVLDNMLQIDAPNDNVNAAQRAPGRVVAREGQVVERKDAQGEKGAGGNGGEERKGEDEIGTMRRIEIRKRSDDEQQLVDEREKANARGDRKFTVQQEGADVHSVSRDEAKPVGVKKKREKPGAVVNKTSELKNGRNQETKNAPNKEDKGRRKMNQVSMLNSRKLADNKAADSVLREVQKLSRNEIEQYAAANKNKLTHNDLKNHGQSILEGKRKKDLVKEGVNATHKRPLIEKASQLRLQRAGYGRLKDMPFMQARRFSQQELSDRQGKVPPRFSYGKIEELAKYTSKLNYFEEFCKEVSEPLVECGGRRPRELTEEEREGRNIMFTIRTTLDYHDKRLPVLFETWLSVVDPRTVFLVTDGEDLELDDITENIGMHYINAQSGTTHSRSDLCCKAGVELELMFYQQNQAFDWLCHVDDDVYINLDSLVRTLAKFDPKNEPVYFGRSGSPYAIPRTVKNESKLGTPNTSYHFAVGGMYCLSRNMLQLVKDHLVGCDAFSQSCQKAQEPEDVTVGLVIGAVLNQELSRTEMIYTHGIDLMSHVPSPYIAEQIAFAYGYGSVESWHFTPNVVYVPGALFSPDEDNTQFKSIHCHLFPTLQWCIDKKQHLAAVLEEVKKSNAKGKFSCVCTWKMPMCCEIWKEAYRKAAEHVMKEKMKAEVKEGHKSGVQNPAGKGHVENGVR